MGKNNKVLEIINNVVHASKQNFPANLVKFDLTQFHQ